MGPVWSIYLVRGIYLSLSDLLKATLVTKISWFYRKKEFPLETHVDPIFSMNCILLIKARLSHQTYQKKTLQPLTRIIAVIKCYNFKIIDVKPWIWRQ